MSSQLPLALSLRAGATFDNFVVGENREAVAALHALARQRTHPVVFIYGDLGAGKTHLLQAACHAVAAAELACAYLPLSEYAQFTPAVLEALEARAVVCIDDIDAVADVGDWQRALLALYERMRGGSGTLVCAARQTPQRVGLTLNDLATRLASGVSYALRALDDGDKLILLQRHARARGLELSDEVARYLLQRYPRDLPSLIKLIERLDRESLAQQRRITIPFLRLLD